MMNDLKYVEELLIYVSSVFRKFPIDDISISTGRNQKNIFLYFNTTQPWSLPTLIYQICDDERCAKVCRSVFVFFEVTHHQNPPKILNFWNRIRYDIFCDCIGFFLFSHTQSEEGRRFFFSCVMYISPRIYSTQTMWDRTIRTLIW